MSALDDARIRLAAYLAAELRILDAGQEGTVATRRRRDADLIEIRKGITDLNNEIAGLEASASGQSRLYTAVPR